MPQDPADRPAPTATTPATPAAAALRSGLHAALHRRTAHLSPTARALLWSVGAGLLFSVLNTVARSLTLHLHPMEAQFLRYLFGVLVMLPLVWRAGLAAYRPQRIGGQFLRGLVHTVGLALWFTALPRIPLADMTAIGFTGPIFILVGAFLFLREPMRWERWLATGIGFAGMLVMLGPKFSGSGGWWHLVMLASAPVFAASFLLTKALTRSESTEVIVFWQALTVTLFSLPLALPVWLWPTPWQWAGFALCGLLGTLGHYCLTRSYRYADISATQSVKFLDLIWASALGFVIFTDLPTVSTLVGGAIISVATVWLAQRESRARARLDEARVLARLDNEP
jgi:drug/metabolite transporter (DMT)-like permease